MTPLLFSLIAMHGGAAYVIDSRLSESECAALSQPGEVSFFVSEYGETITPDASTQFACEVELSPPRPAHVPGDGAGALKLSGAAPHQTRYGQSIHHWNANPVEPPEFHKSRKSKRDGKSKRGRPRNGAS